MNQGFAALAAKHDEEGIHMSISHSVMRVFWRKYFINQPEVLWALWWKQFPKGLEKILGDTEARQDHGQAR